MIDPDGAVGDRAASCFDIAARGLNVIHNVRGEGATWKGRGDLVTAADEASEKFIAAEIRSRFPDDEIICEEGTRYAGSSGFTWLCDPLDGTLNFARQAGPWAISLALLHGSKIVAGCVVDGSSGDVFTAVRGGGAKRNGEAIHVSSSSSLVQSLVGFDCPYDMNARMQTTYPAVGELLQIAAALRCYGSCAVALCMVAAGGLDAYAVEHGKPWDFAAGTLLVREAGGSVTTWSGGEYHPHRHVQVLATNSILHGALRDVVTHFATE